MPYIERAGEAIVAVYDVPQPQLDPATVTQVPPDDAAYLSFKRWRSDDIDTVRRQALDEVDRQAGNVRQPRLTHVAGQANVYELKARQARECLTAYDEHNLPPAGLYEMLEAEVPATAASVLEAAAIIKATEDAFIAEAAQVEAVRMAGKRAVRDAVDVAGIEQALAAIVWPDLGPDPLAVVDPPPATTT